MLENWKETMNEILRGKQNKRRWLSVFLLLSIVVYFVTTAFLTVPSIAVSGRARVCCCPYGEHVHDESCYDAQGRLCCAYAVAHTHDESCYDEDGTLICTLPEIPAHVHDESCYEERRELTCTLFEGEGHVHTDDCYETVRGALICTDESEEHEHTDECYAWDRVLVCGMEEGEGAHVHTDECYTTERVLCCTEPELPVHVHGEDCFRVIAVEPKSDDTADVESAAYWNGMIAGLNLKGVWQEDLITVAESQLGYRESEQNFRMVDGVQKGYTRYGAWYGDPYGDWCAMFVSFCLRYAGIDEEQMPISGNCDRWIEALSELALYREARAEETPAEPDEPEAAEDGGVEPTLPQPGELIFFRMNCEEGSDHVGIVRAVDEETNEVCVLEGNSDNRVQMLRYRIDDERILGYAALPEQPQPVELTSRFTAADGSSYAVSVLCAPESGIPADAELLIREPVDSDAYLAQTAEALGCEQDALGEVRLLDITILCGGEELQPQGAVSVSIRLQDAIPAEDTQVVHLGDEAELLESETVDGEIRFETDGFSIYAIVGGSIEQTVLASDGNNYRVTVTYDDDAGVPEGSTLSVTEIAAGSETYTDLLTKSESALGVASGSAQFVRLFDIKILDPSGLKVILTAPVDVSIELENASDELTQDSKVIHIADNAEQGEIIQNVQIDGESVRFAAEGFSAYAIVNAPSIEETGGWEKLSSMSDLEAHIQNGDGIYIGHVDGYYATSSVTRVNSSRNGITKTEPPQLGQPMSGAVPYFFETVDAANHQYKIYCMNGASRKYVQQSSNSLNFVNSVNSASVFTIEDFGNGEDTNVFRIRGANNYCWNMQGGTSGHCFAAYNNLNDVNARFNFWYFTPPTDDPYDLDGKTYGLMFFNNGLTGKAMMSNESVQGALEAVSMTVLAKNNDREDIIFTPKDSGITRWTFHNVESDIYRITAQVNGETKYLRIDTNDGVTLVDANEIDAGCNIEIVEGGVGREGQIFLRSASNAVLTYSGATNIGFFVGGTVGSEWMRLVDETDLTPDYYMVHTADKVSISDREAVPDGSKVIVYARVWDAQNKRYNFYAVDSDGTLIPVYESGDQIQWFGDRFNTLLWDFTEYFWEGTTDPNGYYELYNEFSQKYIAPQLSSNQILSDEKIGINLNGRKNGYYYSDILAWDDPSYAYAGVAAHIASGEGNQYIEPCSINDTTDFYFALVHDLPSDDTLTEVPTVDNNMYGITMKMVNFGGKTYKDGKNPETTLQQHNVIGDSTGGAVLYANTGLLSNSLDANGYPTATITQASLADLLNSPSNPPVEVNHLFLQSILDGSGYFEYDSTQNFATLKQQDNTYDTNFHVYQELGTYDGGSSRPSLKHGQFFPYDNIEPGNFCTELNPRNLYTSTQVELPEGDPRKNERLYKVENPDYYFGMELEAEFVQTPSGRDGWGHDIIYEFTGDDDFWLYVDGELVIDLGGIHSALAGTVNFCTGDVYVNGTRTTLYATFRQNYIDRYKAANNGAEPSQAELDAYLIGTAAEGYKDGIFEDNGQGQMVFKDYTSHKMKIFYMERGAGASNLHMRFNLSSVKPGTVQLTKQLGNVDSNDSVDAVFPYQIWYTLDDGNGGTVEHRLTNNDALNINVVYKDTTTPVTFDSGYKPDPNNPNQLIYDPMIIDGVAYPDVFLIKPGETIEIKFPDETIDYRIVECGIDKNVYDSVTVDTSDDNEVLTETERNTTTSGTPRYDYSLDYKDTSERPRVVYTNSVDDDALRNLTIRKRLFAEDGVTEIHHDDPIFGADSAIFNFRLYLKTEYDSSFSGASLYPYHVKDNHGNYCYWDVANQCFTSLGETEYRNLSAADQQRATFHTSMNGAISKIPVDYDVEIREILAGTEFRVQERDYEIPDGYSLRDYTLKYGENDPNSVTAVPSRGIDGILPSDSTDDPIVEVNNIKGWGLRVNKIWNDAEYMASRDPIYVAVFVGSSATPFEIAVEEDDGNGGTITTYTSTVRRLDDGVTTMYWYLPHLGAGTVFGDYCVREVAVTNPQPDGKGNYTYSAIDRIDDNETLVVRGTQAGFNSPADFTYTALNEKGVLQQGSNIRTDKITNSRPGVVLKKLDWDGQPLAGAQFTLTLGNTTVGPFTSDANGVITEALLGENVDYSLNEILAPQGYYGIEAPLTLRLTNSGGVNTLTVTPSANAPQDIGDYYVLNQSGANGLPELSIKNRTYTLRFDKQDGMTQELLPGVAFTLHREVTVNGYTGIDFTPLPGYDNLVTDQNGVIPGLDETLPHGVYYLKEKTPAPGYLAMSGYLRFSIGQKGEVEILSEGRENWLNKTVNQAGDEIVYTLAVPNVRSAVQVTLQKVSYDNTQPGNGETPLSGAVFSIYTDQACTTPMQVNGVDQLHLTDTNGNGVFFSGGIAPGVYYVVEESAPAGYKRLPGPMRLEVGSGGVTLAGTWTSGDPNHSVGTTTATAAGYTCTIRNTAGYELPMTGGDGPMAFYVLGVLLILTAGGALLILRRRRFD